MEVNNRLRRVVKVHETLERLRDLTAGSKESNSDIVQDILYPNKKCALLDQQRMQVESGFFSVSVPCRLIEVMGPSLFPS